MFLKQNINCFLCNIQIRTRKSIKLCPKCNKIKNFIIQDGMDKMQILISNNKPPEY